MSGPDNLDIRDITKRIKALAPDSPAAAIEYYQDIRGVYEDILNWLDNSISALRTDMVKTERPHETLARIARETRNTSQGRRS